MPNRNIALWLYFTAFMVFAMAVIGAITRLTESGLSMVEWKPLIGAMPPLSQGEWERVFGLYKETPEYQLKNSWMALEDFKSIFFWEWLHRLWGRVIGLVFALPLLWFWVKGQIPDGYKKPLLGLLALGAAQGALGWFMVMSGLSDRPAVSHFRLAAHLSLAILIYACILWIAFGLSAKDKGLGGSFCQKRHGWISMLALAVTIVWGAFTAGLDGGMLYNTWPTMDGHMIPPEASSLYALAHDPGAVQFVHRWLAVGAALIIASFAIRMNDFPLLLAVAAQVGLGIATVLSQAAIPLAALHQAGALTVLSFLLWRLRLLHLKAQG